MDDRKRNVNQTLINIGIGEQEKILRKPLIFSEIYFIFTILLYSIGPVNWENTNSLFLYSLLILYQVAFRFGYLHEINKVNIGFSGPLSLSNTPANSSKFINFIILFGLIMTTISTFTYTATTSLPELLQMSIEGITNPFATYYASFEIERETGYIYTVIVLMAPITWSAFPLSVGYFKKLNPIFKLITVIMFIMEACRWVALGRNKGVFDLAIIIATIIGMQLLQDRFRAGTDGFMKKKKSNTNLKLVIVGSLLVIIISYFSNAISERAGSSYFKANYDAPLMDICPEFLQPTLIYLTSYLTQGYHSFSNIIDVEWEPMFGVGNSMFLMANVGGLLKTELYQYTYQTRLMTKGIDSMSAWHSFYTWVANDVHWIGVIFIMYLLGRYFAYIVKKCIIDREPITYSLVCLFSVMIFYFPANNQVFSQGNTFMAFWVLTLYWWMVRNKKFFIKSM